MVLVKATFLGLIFEEVVESKSLIRAVIPLTNFTISEWFIRSAIKWMKRSTQTNNKWGKIGFHLDLIHTSSFQSRCTLIAIFYYHKHTLNWSKWSKHINLLQHLHFSLNPTTTATTCSTLYYMHRFKNRTWKYFYFEMRLRNDVPFPQNLLRYTNTHIFITVYLYWPQHIASYW